MGEQSLLGGRATPVSALALPPSAPRPGERAGSSSRSHTLGARGVTLSSGRADLPGLRPPAQSLWRGRGGAGFLSQPHPGRAKPPPPASGEVGFKARGGVKAGSEGGWS